VTSFEAILVRSRDEVEDSFYHDMIKIKIDQLFLKGTRAQECFFTLEQWNRGQNNLLLEKISEANQKGPGQLERASCRGRGQGLMI